MAYIESVKFELGNPVTLPTITTFIANRVQIDKEVVSKRWRTALKNNRIQLAGFHLQIQIQSDLIEYVSGTNLDAIRIQNILDNREEDHYIYPNSSLSTKFKVIGTGENSNLYRTTYGVRDNTDIITCVTADLLSQSDVDSFKRGGTIED